MTRIWIATLVVITALLANGCGTICNLRSTDPDVYGGVQKDMHVILTPGGIEAKPGGPGDAIPFLFVAADAALSLVADTLTLPVVVRMRHNDVGKNEETNPASREKEEAPEAVSLGAPRPLPLSSESQE